MVRGTTWFLRTTNDPAVTNRVLANLRALPGIIAELKRRGYGS